MRKEDIFHLYFLTQHPSVRPFSSWTFLSSLNCFRLQLVLSLLPIHNISLLLLSLTSSPLSLLFSFSLLLSNRRDTSRHQSVFAFLASFYSYFDSPVLFLFFGTVTGMSTFVHLLLLSWLQIRNAGIDECVEGFQIEIDGGDSSPK